MKQYKFKPIFDASQHNWQMLEQLNSYTAMSFETSGFSSGACYGMISYDGPRVHLYLWIYDNPIWADNAYIILPAAPYLFKDRDFVLEVNQHIGPIIDYNTHEALNNEYCFVTTHTNGRGRLNFLNSGSVTTLATISGSYIRA